MHVHTYYRPTAAETSLSIARHPISECDLILLGAMRLIRPLPQTCVCYRVSLPTPTGRRHLDRLRRVPQGAAVVCNRNAPTLASRQARLVVRSTASSRGRLLSCETVVQAASWVPALEQQRPQICKAY